MEVGDVRGDQVKVPSLCDRFGVDMNVVWYEYGGTASEYH